MGDFSCSRSRRAFDGKEAIDLVGDRRNFARVAIRDGLRRRPELLERHSRHHTSHASLVAEILNLLAGKSPAPSPGEPEPLRESLSDSEKRILRYLPTHLSAPEIAGELYLSVHTVKSHTYHIYAKLGTHKRAETVARARALGLLAPSSRQR